MITNIGLSPSKDEIKTNNLNISGDYCNYSTSLNCLKAVRSPGLQPVGSTARPEFLQKTRDARKSSSDDCYGYVRYRKKCRLQRKPLTILTVKLVLCAVLTSRCLASLASSQTSMESVMVDAWEANDKELAREITKASALLGNFCVLTLLVGILKNSPLICCFGAIFRSMDYYFELKDCFHWSIDAPGLHVIKTSDQDSAPLFAGRKLHDYQNRTFGPGQVFRLVATIFEILLLLAYAILMSFSWHKMSLTTRIGAFSSSSGNSLESGIWSSNGSRISGSSRRTYRTDCTGKLTNSAASSLSYSSAKTNPLSKPESIHEKHDYLL